jgi:hypothetical protein
VPAAIAGKHCLTSIAKEMNEESQIDRDKAVTDKDVSNQGSSSQPKRDHAKWIGIATTFLSIFLAFLTYRLDADRRKAETQVDKKVEQLKAGNKVTIPIAHTVGPVYSESLVIPMKVSWYNPLLKRQEEKSFDTEGMMSDLDAKYRGFLRGNVSQISCP